MDKTKINFKLYLVTDRKLAGESELADVVKLAIKGGITVLQYREKNSTTAEMLEQAKKLLALTKKAKIPLIINDRLDVALAISADGVHVGQDDMPASIARSLLGPDKILGITVKTVKQAREAEKDGADYLGAGDIFGTTSKSDAGIPIGLEMLKKISYGVSIPVVGIGGITKENAASVIESGADGIAVISAIIGQPDTQNSARELLKIISL